MGTAAELGRALGVAAAQQRAARPCGRAQQPQHPAREGGGAPAAGCWAGPRGSRASAAAPRTRLRLVLVGWGCGRAAERGTGSARGGARRAAAAQPATARSTHALACTEHSAQPSQTQPQLRAPANPDPNRRPPRATSALCTLDMVQEASTAALLRSSPTTKCCVSGWAGGQRRGSRGVVGAGAQQPALPAARCVSRRGRDPAALRAAAPGPAPHPNGQRQHKEGAKEEHKGRHLAPAAEHEGAATAGCFGCGRDADARRRPISSRLHGSPAALLTPASRAVQPRHSAAREPRRSAPPASLSGARARPAGEAGGGESGRRTQQRRPRRRRRRR